MDREEYPAAFVGLVTAVLIVEMVLGLVFNVSVLVVSRGKMVSGAERGNTFLASLSVVDIVACLSALPLTMAEARVSRYHNDLLLCLFTEGAVAMSSTASSLTLLLISLERYQAVTMPAQRGILSNRPAVFLAMMWSLSLFTFSAPFFLFQDADDTGWNSTLNDVSTSIHDADNVTESVTLSSSHYMNEIITTTFDTLSFTEKLATDSYYDVLENSSFQDASNRSLDRNESDTETTDEKCSGISCGCQLIQVKFFRVYEVVYVAAFFLTSLAMTMFCLAIMRVVRRRVAAKEAAATRQTAAAAAVASTSRNATNNNAAIATSHSGSMLRTMATLEVQAHSSSTAVSDEKDRETEGVENELRMYISHTSLNPHIFNAGHGTIRFIQPLQTDSPPSRQPSYQPPQRRDTALSCIPRDVDRQVPVEEDSWVQRQHTRQQRQQRRRRFGRQEDSQPAIPGVAQERRVLRVSLGIASAFLFCWGPHMVLTLVEMVLPDDMVLQAVHVATLLLAYASVVIHPLVYAFSRKQFREALSKPWRRYRMRRKTAVRVA